MKSYIFRGQYISKSSGCGGCGTARTIKVLQTNGLSNIVIGGRSITASPGQVYEFSDQEVPQIVAWNEMKTYLFEEIL